MLEPTRGKNVLDIVLNESFYLTITTTTTTQEYTTYYGKIIIIVKTIQYNTIP